MLQLIRAKDNDISVLADIKKSAFKEEFKKYGFTPEDMIRIEWHKKMLINSIYYAIYYNNEIVGGVNIFKGDKGEYYLCSLFIVAELQNKGIGKQTMDLLETLHNDGKKWQLETPSMSTQNHHFYEKCGYKYVKDMTPDGAPEGFSLRVYEKIMD
ncbi:GNAT family N-acetyltransferase [Vallitalea pronyensis]|uniref:GNAT family N-acetyltransferase n=1 Tax=Vallitalea pronyensis TaxID=1348613 RepID=A0A8J8SI93_9FIRM|nr:GNAT family N-acetyltransferase [Vallitalea pronyensis]QUI24222.1 GNAT family N-acetyltransferase [Vallitalea pronyensis]